jgi:hypothetical protein
VRALVPCWHYLQLAGSKHREQATRALCGVIGSHASSQQCSEHSGLPTAAGLHYSHWLVQPLVPEHADLRPTGWFRPLAAGQCFPSALANRSMEVSASIECRLQGPGNGSNSSATGELPEGGLKVSDDDTQNRAALINADVSSAVAAVTQQCLR